MSKLFRVDIFMYIDSSERDIFVGDTLRFGALSDYFLNIFNGIYLSNHLSMYISIHLFLLFTCQLVVPSASAFLRPPLRTVSPPPPVGASCPSAQTEHKAGGYTYKLKPFRMASMLWDELINKRDKRLDG